MKAAIVGIAGTALSAAEACLFAVHPPAGVILFARNVTGPGQLRALTGELRRVLPAGAGLMVDQEGGRVARLRPPHWRAHPPAEAFGARAATDPGAAIRAAWLTGALIGLQCAVEGFDVVCAPVLDVRAPGAHDVIGDRSFGTEPRMVARLGRAMAAGLLAGGVQPVMKHAPGHGQARADSHRDLPVVESNDLAADMLPFALNSDLPWAMTAHILYTALDPRRPATLSPAVIGDVIRGRMGFGGVLVSDDLAMGALKGEPVERARGALAAGCDLALYCAGDPAANEALLAECPELDGESAARFARAGAVARARRIVLDADALAADRDRVLG